MPPRTLARPRAIAIDRGSIIACTGQVQRAAIDHRADDAMISQWCCTSG